MSSLIQSPFVRNSYPAIDNPVYSQDTVAANQGILDMVAALAGLGGSDFAIFSGLEYIQPISGSNYYTPGFFFFNGVWYYQPTDFNEGLRLVPNITGIMPYVFSDSVVRDTYDVNYSQSTSSPTGATIVFSGNMNDYRLDNKTLLSEIKVLQTATILENVQEATLGSTYIATFENDKAIFFASATTNTILSFDFTNAVPGTVLRLKWTYGSGVSMTVSVGSGQTAYLESGELASTTSNTNILYILYAGLNSLGNDEVSLTLTQVTAL